MIPIQAGSDFLSQQSAFDRPLSPKEVAEAGIEVFSLESN
jgi:hypothetical protein